MSTREWSILGHVVSMYRSSFEGERGYEKGFHGRVSAHVCDAGERVLATARVEYHAPTNHFGARVSLGHDDEPMKASLQLLAAGVYLSADHALIRRLRQTVCDAFPDKVSKYSGRELSLSVHDTAVWWCVGADDMGWSSNTPRWMKGSWHPLGFHMRQGEPELVEEREVLVPMSERSYRAVARLTTARWGFTKLPRYFDRIGRSVNIEMLDGEQIPCPGKGENSWDCGEDATFSMSATGDTIEDGIGRLVASVLRSRRRYGGPAWVPEAVRSAG